MDNQSIYESIFNSHPNSSIIIDKEHIIIGYNHSALHSANQLILQPIEIGNSIYNVINKKHIEKIKNSIHDALQGNVVEYELKVIDEDHLQNWFEVSVSPIMLKSDVIGVNINSRPIKKRKIIEESLTHRLAFEQLVSKISSRFISFTDLDYAINISLEDMGRFSSASRAYIFLFNDDNSIMNNTHEWCSEGVTPEIKNLKDLPSDIFPWWMSKLKKGEIILITDVGKLSEEAKSEKGILEAQGIASVVVLPIYVHKKLHGFIGFDNIIATKGWKREDLSLLQLTSEIFSNAFERLSVDQALRSSERRFRELFHNANDMISVHTVNEMKFIEANNLICSKTGYIREELLKMSAIDLCAPEFKDYMANLHKVIENDDHITYEMVYISKEGQHIPVEMHAYLFMFNNEQVVMVIAKDITDRMRMEIELKENNLALQGIINKLKETQSQLIQQEQLAGIGQLAAGVAHEINNPLAFTISNFDTLKRYLKTFKDGYNEHKAFFNESEKLPELNTFLDKLSLFEAQYRTEMLIDDLDEIILDIQEGLHRVDTIVKGLSSFSRVDYQETFREFDLHEGINNTLTVAINEYKYYTKIEKVLNPIPMVFGNPGQINQVLLNLLLNAAYAIKAKTMSSKGIIRIETYKDETYIYCVISDNGIGISEEHINKIFNPFFTTKPVGEGTGLGLSIAYDIIVNKHHGEIEVESSPNGTNFIIKFPFKNKI